MYARAAVALGLGVLYLASRVPRLLAVPLFLDEASHIVKAREAVQGNLKAGAGFGKWLSVQAYGIWVRSFGDSVHAARMLAVVLGLAVCAVLLGEGMAAGGRSRVRRGVLSAAFYVVLPFAFFYDRLALTDQFLTLILAAMVWMSFAYVRKGETAPLLGACAAVALAPLFKTNGLVLAPVPLVVVLLGTDRSLMRDRLRRLWLPYAVALGAVVASAVLYTRQVTNTGSVLPAQWSASAVLTMVAVNMRDLGGLAWNMLTPAVVALVGIGGIAVLASASDDTARRRTRAAFGVLLCVVLPYALVFENWYPRYLLPALVPVCIIAAEVTLTVWRALARTRRGGSLLAQACLVVAVLAFPAVVSARMLARPASYRYPQRVEDQYFTGWTSGWGLEDGVTRLRELSLASEEGINLVRFHLGDHPLWGVDVYREKLGSKVGVVGVIPGKPGGASAQVAAAVSSGKPTYLLHNSANPDPVNAAMMDEVRGSFDAVRVAEFPRRGGNPGLAIWQLAPRAAGD